MQAIYNGNSKKSGIYKITNTTNGRIYIGSAKEFKERYKSHLYSLRKGTHHNKYLQADFNKCGEEVFEFHVVEVVEGEQSIRLSIEQTYIDKFYDNQEACYNFKQNAKAESKTCWSKNPEETIRKRLEKLIGRKHTEEQRKNISNALKSSSFDFKKHTDNLWKKEEHREKLKEHLESFHERVKDKSHTPEACEKRIKKMKENNPNCFDHLKEVYFKKGHIPWNKNKKASEETRKKISEAGKGRPAPNRMKISQLDKEGNFIKVWDSIDQAQKQLNINNIRLVICGKRKTAGGFKWIKNNTYL